MLFLICALRTLAVLGLSLDPEGKEKGSWSHSSADLVFTAHDAAALKIVALVAAQTNA